MYTKNRIKIFCLILVVFGFGVSSVKAQNILIFSTSHSNTGPTDVKSAQGMLKLQVSTFSPIVEIWVNDDFQSPQGKTSAQLDVPYELSAGENRFRVSVKTEAVQQTKEFVLNLIEPMDKPAGKAKKPFQLIVMGNVEQSDNATSVKENKEADTKIGLTVIPRYNVVLNENSDLLIQGLVYRDKYSNSDLPSPQVEFSQLSASWNNKEGFGDWQLDMGYSDIGSTTAADATRAEVESGPFIGGSVRLNALNNKNVNLGLKYTMKNAPEAVAEDYDGDGSVLALNASWDTKFDPIGFQLNGGYKQNDAKGMYQDYSATSLGAKGDFSLNKEMTLSGLLKTKQTAYVESDPLKGDKEASTLTTVSVKGSYKISMVKGLVCGAAVTQKQQSSNITSKEYVTLLVGLNVIYIY